jgi:hypothetical protein
METVTRTLKKEERQVINILKEIEVLMKHGNTEAAAGLALSLKHILDYTKEVI